MSQDAIQLNFQVTLTNMLNFYHLNFPFGKTVMSVYDSNTNSPKKANVIR